jgi:hypothetical protein
MRFLPRFGSTPEQSEDAAPAKDAPLAHPAELDLTPEESHLLKTAGLVSAALGAVAIGLILGREIRQRYKFNRRTPYDLYAHSGDETPDVEFGVGI